MLPGMILHGTPPRRWLRALCENSPCTLAALVPRASCAGHDPTQYATETVAASLVWELRCSLSPDLRGYRKQKTGRIAAAPILSRALSASEPSPPRNAVCPGLATPCQAVLLQAKKQSHARPHCPSRSQPVAAAPLAGAPHSGSGASLQTPPPAYCAAAALALRCCRWVPFPPWSGRRVITGLLRNKMPVLHPLLYTTHLE